MSGKYNFGEWENHELGRQLTAAGHTSAALAILEMNSEFHPESSAIDFMIAELHRGRGDTGQAIRRDRTALEKSPDHSGAQRWLAKLTKP